MAHRLTRIGAAALLTLASAGCGNETTGPGTSGGSGAFAFRPPQPIAVPYTNNSLRQVAGGDVNGDGRLDLVFNEQLTGQALTRVHLALGQMDGSFQLQPPVEHHLLLFGEGHRLLMLDTNGDGRDELVWNHLGFSNIVTLAFYIGDGAWAWRDPQFHSNNGWGTYTAAVGDANGDGREDIIWSSRSTASLRHYFGFAGPTGFAMITNWVDRAGNYSGYQPSRMGRFNGDAYDDVVVNALGELFNNTYVGTFTPAGTVTGALTWVLHERVDDHWTSAQFLIGDIDGRDGDDLIWVKATGSDATVFRSINGGAASFTAHDGVEVPGTGPATAYVGDFNDDDRSDLLLLHRSSGIHRLTVGLGATDGSFNFASGTQEHPDPVGFGSGSDLVLIGDVNGDDRDDVVWVDVTNGMHVMVALAR